MRKVLSLVLVLAIFATSLLALVPTGTRAATVIVDPRLDAALTDAQPTDLLQVVVTFESPLDASQLTTLLGIVTEGQALKQLPMALVAATPAQIAQLQLLPGVRSLYLEQPLQYFMRESVPLIGADRVWNELGYDGSGVTVAVLDSGIDGTHPDLPFGSKVVENVKIVGLGNLYQVVEDLPNSDTSSGHGTHVAGTVAGSGAASEGTFKGVAPGASLIGIGAGDGISIFAALAGFDWVLQHNAEHPGVIDIVTNSWGTSGEFDPENPINRASKAVHDAGIVVLFASGNAGPGTDTLNPYSVAPWVIGVAAGNKDGETLADFSSRGRPGDPLYHPTLTAPGVDIVSTRAPNTVLPPLAIGDDLSLDPAWLPYYTTMSGTSMATPHVAGVAALLLQANPNLTPDALKQVLVDTARPMPQYGEYAAGAGYVDAYAAVELATQIKKVKKHKQKNGETIDVYVVEQLFEGTVGPAVASYNRQLATTPHGFGIDSGAVFLDTQLTWDNALNDLDLILLDPSGAQAGASQEFQALSGEAREGVSLDSPVAGSWTAEVRGWLNTPQSYTLRVESYYPITQ